jgi:TetR/AcrR family transcriptional regulator, transcriptional repressor of aconitase
MRDPLVKNEHSFYDSVMARVPQEHLDARRRQILDAARRRFIDNGFHATSMQDLLTEADLSAGAVYRYFKGKDDIIAAITSQALDEVGAMFDRLDAAQPPPLDSIVDLVLGTGSSPLDTTPEAARLLVQIWSEALRSPSLTAHLDTVFEGARRVIARLVAQHQRQGLLPADVPPEHIAQVLIAFVDGFMVRRAVSGDADPVAFRQGLRALIAAR